MNLLKRWKDQLIALTKQTNICKICFKKFESINHKAEICQNCYDKFECIYENWKICNIDILAIYRYNNFFKSLLYQFKGCYDIELRNVFLEKQLPFLKMKYFGYYIVCIPSSLEDDKKRGFNHVEEIFKLLNLNHINVLRKKFAFKQSDLPKKEREKIIDKLEVIDGFKIKDKKILLVDDVLTTGSSIKSAIRLITKYHPKDIKVLVLAHNCRKNRQ